MTASIARRIVIAGLSLVTVGAMADVIVWDAGTSGNWSVNPGDTPWVGPVLFQDGDDVVFGDNPSGATIVSKVGTVTPGSILFTNDTVAYAITNTGAFAGSGALDKYGAAAVLLGTANAGYSGQVTIHAGSLELSSFQALGSAAITLAGGTLILQKGGANGIFGTGEGHAVTLTADATISLKNSNNAQYGQLGSLDIGAQRLTFTQSGSAGSLQIGAGGARFADGGVFDIQGTTPSANSLSMALLINGPVSNDGVGDLVKDGPGALGLNNAANTFTGDVRVLRGRLGIAANGSLGDAGNHVYVGDGTYAADLWALSGVVTNSHALTVADGSGLGSGATATLVIATPKADLTLGAMYVADSSTVRFDSDLPDGGPITNRTATATLILAGSNADYLNTITVNQGGIVRLERPQSMIGGTIDLSLGTLGRMALQGAGSPGTYTFGIGNGAGQVLFPAISATTTNRGIFAIGGDAAWDPGNGGSLTLGDTAANNRIYLADRAGNDFSRILFGNDTGDLTVGANGFVIRNQSYARQQNQLVMRYALTDDDAGSRLFQVVNTEVVLTRPAISDANPLRVSLFGGSLAVSAMAQLPDGNLNLAGGALILDGVSWDDFIAARPLAVGTNDYQWRLTGGGFAARNGILAITDNGTDANTFNTNFTLGAHARGGDGAFYADGDVDVQVDTVLTVGRTITAANVGPGLTGPATGRPTMRFSGDLSGAGYYIIRSVVTGGGAGTPNQIGEVVFSGENTLTGPLSFLDGPAYVNSGPGGGVHLWKGTGFVRFDDTARLSGTSMPQGDGSTPFQLIAMQRNTVQTSDTDGLSYGYLLTGDADGQVYELPAYGRMVFGNPEGAIDRGGTLGATSEGVAGGNATLQNAVVLINAGTAAANQTQLLLVRDGAFTLGTSGNPVRLIPSYGGDVGLSTTRTPFADATTGLRYLTKRGEGTLVLGNVEYTDLGMDGQGGGADTSARFRWTIGRNNGIQAGTVIFDGAIRETATSGNAGSLAGFAVTLGGGVIEVDGALYGGVYNPVARATAAAGQFQWGGLGGGFAAVNGDVTVNVVNGTAGNTSRIGWSGSDTPTGGATINDNCALILGSRTTDSTLILQNTITLGTPGTGSTANRYLQIMRGVSDAAAEADIQGQIINMANDANKAFYIIGDGRVRFSNADNTFGGGTFGVLGGTLLLGGNDLGTANNRVLGGAHTAGLGVVLGDSRAFGVSGNLDAAILIDGGYEVSRALRVQAGNEGRAILGGSSADDSLFSGAIVLNKDLHVTAADGLVTFSGTISNGTTTGNSVVKIGDGVVRLTGNNTFDGGAEVQAGALKAGADNALGSGAVTVAGGLLEIENGVLVPNTVLVSGGGTIGGAGTVGAASTIGDGGNLAPGTSPGTLSFASDLTLAGDVTYLWELGEFGGLWDAIAVGGDLFLGGLAGLTVQVSLHPTATMTGDYTLFDVAGTTTGFQPGDWVVNGAPGYTVAQQGDDIVLTPVPEPGTLALLALGVAGLWARRRRS